MSNWICYLFLSKTVHRYTVLSPKSHETYSTGEKKHFLTSYASIYNFKKFVCKNAVFNCNILQEHVFEHGTAKSV